MYNCYVGFSVPMSSFMQCNPGYSVTPMASPMGSFLQSVSENYDGVKVDVLANVDLSQFAPGTQMYIGYGTSYDEMMSAGRYNSYTVN